MPIDMQALARAGATVRIAELRQEIADLQAAFADLDGGGATKRPGRPAKQAAAEVPRARKPMSAAARKAVSKRMASYWGKRRESASAPATEAAPAAAEAPPEKPEAKTRAKRTISAEGRARIAAAQKKRWAKTKRGKNR